MNKNKYDRKSPSSGTEKLQKILARRGLGSRRQMEEWIQAGRVKVNGQPAELGVRVCEKDKVVVDGKPVIWKPMDAFKTRILLYYKPEGVICTRSDPQGRPTVFEQLPQMAKGRWISIGRLDINTMGLLLLTNNGELAHRLMHPSFEVEREYAVRVFGEIQDDILSRLKTGVELEDGKARFETIQGGGGAGINHWYQVTLKEGRCRLVRRLWESQGVQVSRLMRIRYGNISLPRAMRSGRWEELETSEVEKLMLLVFPEMTRNTFKKEVNRNRRNSKSRPQSSRSTKTQPRSTKVGKYKNPGSR